MQESDYEALLYAAARRRRNIGIAIAVSTLIMLGLSALLAMHLQAATARPMPLFDRPMTPVVLAGERDESVIALYEVFHDLNARSRRTWASVHLGLFSSSQRLRWNTDSLGRATEDDAAHRVVYATLGDVVVVTDTTPHLRVLSTRTGATLRRVPLSDRADDLCVVGEHEVWLSLIDGHAIAIDTVSGAQRPMAAPPCARQPTPCTAWRVGESTTCTETSADAPANLAVRRVLREGATTIAVGTRTPGTAVPLAVAQVNGVAVWQRPVPASEPFEAREEAPDAMALAGGVFYVAFARKSGDYGLTAIDAATGTTRWQVLRPQRRGSTTPSGRIDVGAQRLYVHTPSWTDIYDRTNGSYVGGIGQP